MTKFKKVSICDIDFLTFANGKFETLKFQNCPNETKILQSNYKITSSECESQQGTQKLNKMKLFYQEHFVSLMEYHKRL